MAESLRRAAEAVTQAAVVAKMPAHTLTWVRLRGLVDGTDQDLVHIHVRWLRKRE